MSKVLDELKLVISKSPLPANDQNDLLVFLPILPDKVIEELTKFFKKDPKFIIEFNRNFKSKVEALADGLDDWQKIIDREEKMGKEYEDGID